jgi:hypothetical protein
MGKMTHAGVRCFPGASATGDVSCRACNGTSVAAIAESLSDRTPVVAVSTSARLAEFVVLPG